MKKVFYLKWNNDCHEDIEVYNHIMILKDVSTEKYRIVKLETGMILEPEFNFYRDVLDFIYSKATVYAKVDNVTDYMRCAYE